jgi:hypothetical protein
MALDAGQTPLVVPTRLAYQSIRVKIPVEPKSADAVMQSALDGSFQREGLRFYRPGC